MGYQKTNAHGLQGVGVEDVPALVGTSADASIASAADKDAAMRANPPEHQPATARLIARAGGKLYEVEATPRPGMSRMAGLIIDASEQLERQGVRDAFFTLADSKKEETCKN